MKGNNQDGPFCIDLPTSPRPTIGKVLVTGATGYIGGRLVQELAERGYDVRIMARAASPEIKERWPSVEVAIADAQDSHGLSEALNGVHTAYYLIHSLLLGKKKFEQADIRAAHNFRCASDAAGVTNIIYLGGLGDVQTPLSPHLKSRAEVALELHKGRASLTKLRAAVIIGSGSASYEIIKHLVLNIPIILLPKWARTKCQPIGIRDVIKYLVGVLESPRAMGGSYDIGGKDILTYGEMMKNVAQLMNKKRLFIPVAFSRTKVYGYLASLFTPVPGPVTMCLMGGCKNEVVCQDNSIQDILPFDTIGFKEQVVRAMGREEQDNVHTRWSDAYPPAHELALKLHELDPPPRYTASFSLESNKKNASIFRSICKIGGKEGYFHSNLLWRLRGAVDRILMGVGTSRGRRSSATLRINDVIDFWRVEDLKIDRMLLLRAEMKLPGRAWLRFWISDEPGAEIKKLSVGAYFHTRSFWGKLYWYLFLPLHYFIFYDIIRQIEKRS